MGRTESAQQEGITPDELTELIGLISSVEKTECFGVRDVARHEMLRRKATRRQFIEAYVCNKFPMWQIKKFLGED